MKMRKPLLVVAWRCCLALCPHNVVASNGGMKGSTIGSMKTFIKQPYNNLKNNKKKLLKIIQVVRKVV